MGVVDASFGHPLKLEEEAAAHLAGGIANHGYQCGMLWGAALAAGVQAYQLLGLGSQAETRAIIAAQMLVESFRARTNKRINCLEITGLNLQGKTAVQPILKFFIKGGPIYCFRLAAEYARDTYSGINTALSEISIETPSPPVSCAAMLAQKMGASDMHTVMAAGFAGGIGLSGAACGALGAAIWIIGMNDHKEEVDDNFRNSRITDTINGFIRSTDNKFECSEISGRRFENIGDHAGYLRNGGCSEIIEALATR